MRSPVEPLRILRSASGELVDGIERQKLDACSRVDFLLREAAANIVHDAGGPLIAVTNGNTYAIEIFIEQHVIYAPAIDPDAGDRMRRLCARDALLDLRNDPFNIPALVPGSRIDSTRCGEPADLVQLPLTFSNFAEHNAPASRTKINGETLCFLGPDPARQSRTLLERIALSAAIIADVNINSQTGACGEIALARSSMFRLGVADGSICSLASSTCRRLAKATRLRNPASFIASRPRVEFHALHRCAPPWL